MTALELLKAHGLIKEGSKDLIIKTDNGEECSLIALMNLYTDRKISQYKLTMECDHPYMSIIGEETGNPECLACGKKLR